MGDRACAQLWAEHWARRSYADTLIRSKLLAKGFVGASVNNAIKHVGSGEGSEVERAHRVIRKEKMVGAARFKRERLSRLLVSRGFDADLIEQVISDTLGPEYPNE